MSNTQTFEELLHIAEALPRPQEDGTREVHWCGDGQVLGLSRQRGGGFELFLCGQELHASSHLVRRHLKFDCWSRTGGIVFQANRLVFPANDHFIAIAAFLAEELLRRNVENALESGFAQTEPLIEMALQRLTLSEDQILGLLGELRFLEILLSTARPDRRAAVLDSWRGYEHSSRDFVFGRKGVEVKSTRRDHSIHPISNVMQVDLRRTSSGEPDEELFLLSLGFEAVLEAGNVGPPLSLPTQVDQVMSLLAPPYSTEGLGELQSLFLAKVASYGGDACLGYQHGEMRNWSAYKTNWQHRFIRIYDMSDPAIQVFRRDDIQLRTHVILDSVNFTINLPNSISGDLNPQTDPFTLAQHFLG